MHFQDAPKLIRKHLKADKQPEILAIIVVDFGNATTKPSQPKLAEGKGLQGEVGICGLQGEGLWKRM